MKTTPLRIKTVLILLRAHEQCPHGHAPETLLRKQEFGAGAGDDDGFLGTGSAAADGAIVALLAFLVVFGAFALLAVHLGRKSASMDDEELHAKAKSLTLMVPEAAKASWWRLRWALWRALYLSPDGAYRIRPSDLEDLEGTLADMQMIDDELESPTSPGGRRFLEWGPREHA
eukprot:7548959-Pyramimonas_sp.AAC.1